MHSPKIKWSKLRMKKFNLAVLPLAVAGVLASTSAFAGTEACFEVYQGADDFTPTAFGTTYDPAACVKTAVSAATNTTLQANDVLAIAYELTGEDLIVDFDDVDGTVSGAETDQVIVYIPTTDIPGGTKLVMELSGSSALFSGNANQIHLVKDTDGAGVGTDFESVASSDGVLDGTSIVTFITKAGITIGAGTRLVLSKNSSGTVGADLDPVGLLLDNDDCTDADSASSVRIQSISAVTDGGGGYSIIGAISDNIDKQEIINVTPQFYAFHEGVLPTKGSTNVNAESSDNNNVAIVARTQFVYDATDIANQLDTKQYEVVFKTGFYDRSPVLDQFITLDAGDELDTQFVTGSNPGDDVEMGLWNARTAATGAHTEQESVEIGTLFGLFGLTDLTAPTYATVATDLFTPNVVGGDPEGNVHIAADDVLTGALYNTMYYNVTNRVTSSIMNFNYVVDTHYTLDFGTADEIDHCAKEAKSHEIGVNGAVLKVPYITSAEGNFVRVTNEHDEAAEVTFDIFGESDDGTETNRKVTAVALGTVAAQSSVVYFMPDVMAAADAAGYLGADGGYAAGDLGSNAASGDNRHTVTFTVTAPRDSVHGVSVQKIVGAIADRVMPVLDQNAWSQ